MNVISLSALDLGLAAVLVILLSALTWWLKIGNTRSLLIAGLRTAVQLLLLGHVLRLVFSAGQWYWVAAIMAVMLLVAGYEVNARQHRPFSGWWGYGMGTLSMFASSFSILLMALLLLVQPQPWYQPQYAIPLLGMLLGNSMTGVALSLDRLTESAWKQRKEIEARLMLGHDWNEAISNIRIEALRSGLMPIINAMAAAGIVSLPGTMTGQILAGVSPVEASKYQILIMFLITAASGLGSVIAVQAGARRLFDDRERLTLSRLKSRD